jgi:tRNA (Thr-GGU) A37 N-methylase
VKESSYDVRPIGFIRSTLKDRNQAPKQGHEGAPDAWLEVLADFRGSAFVDAGR